MTVDETILAYIEDFVKYHGYPPTVLEIGAHVGLSSGATVHKHLRKLEAEGKLIAERRGPRTLTLTVVR